MEGDAWGTLILETSSIWQLNGNKLARGTRNSHRSWTRERNLPQIQLVNGDDGFMTLVSLKNTAQLVDRRVRK
jgi:hypothetical protein